MLPQIGRPSFLAVCAALSMAGLAISGSAAGAQPVARAAHTCTPPNYPGLGYFTSMSVTGTSCSTGSKVAVAYYHCRLKHGVKGTCHGGVLGFNCSEKRNSIATEIDARVTCTKGSKKVVHTYQQDT